MVTLIVNPEAGRAGLFRGLSGSPGFRVVQTSAEVGSAGRLAAEAARDSWLVVACGGDGTVHDAVQGLVGTQAAFGVVPLGTHNALARNLGLPVGRVGEALERLLTYRPVRVPLGEVSVGGMTRYFAVMCGCGPDGALAHAIADSRGGRLKRRLGAAGYPMLAAQLFLTRRWPEFEVEYRLAGSEEWLRRRAVAVLCSRVPNLGGMFGGLTGGAALAGDSLHLQVLRPPGHLSMAAWMGLTRFGIRHGLAESLDVEEVRCSATGEVYAQADAEAIGVLPMRMRVVRDALTMMLPGGGR